MLAVTEYTRLPLKELLEELELMTSTLNSQVRDLTTAKEDYNRDYYTAYIRTPGSSVAAKDKEATYSCIELVNQISYIEAEIKAAENTIALLNTLILHAC